MRIRRLVGHAPSISQMLPGPGAVFALTLLCLVGVGASAMHGSQAQAPHLAIRAFQHQILPALLYDPLFEPPHGAAQARVPVAVEAEPLKPPETVATPDNQHGHRITFEPAYLVESNEPMVAPPPATLAAMIARLGPDSGLTPEARFWRNSGPLTFRQSTAVRIRGYPSSPARFRPSPSRCGLRTVIPALSKA